MTSRSANPRAGVEIPAAAEPPALPAAPSLRTRMRQRRSVAIDVVISLSILVAALALMQWLTTTDRVSQLIVPTPTDVWVDLREGIASGLYLDAFWSTTWGTLVGFAASLVAAITLASVFAIVPRLERIFAPYTVAFQSMPKIAIAPLILIWFGFGFRSKVVIVVAVSFFPIFINTLAGLRVRDRAQWELMTAMGASRWQLFRYVRFPAALPFIWTGLRAGAVFSLIGAVVAELLGVTQGLGYLLTQYKANFNTAGVFAVLFLLVIVGLVFEFVTRAIGKRVVFWDKDAAKKR